MVNARDDDLPADLLGLWQRWISTDSTRLDSLLGRYRERHRRYHTLTHIALVVHHVDELAADEAVTDLGAVIAAALYHDAIYEPRYPANERASARLARRDLGQLGWVEDRIDAVAAMIEATHSHTDPPDTDTGVLFDADLAILGAASEDYESYVKAVRSEYRHLDDDEWSAGRTQVLQGLIDRESIFSTGSGVSRWEEPSRRNVSAELAALSQIERST